MRLFCSAALCQGILEEPPPSAVARAADDDR